MGHIVVSTRIRNLLISSLLTTTVRRPKNERWYLKCMYIGCVVPNIFSHFILRQNQQMDFPCNFCFRYEHLFKDSICGPQYFVKFMPWEVFHHVPLKCIDKVLWSKGNISYNWPTLNIHIIVYTSYNVSTWLSYQTHICMWIWSDKWAFHLFVFIVMVKIPVQSRCFSCSLWCSEVSVKFHVKNTH